MTKDFKIAIIGTGAMGTALGKVLYDSGYKNLIHYGVDKKEVKELSQGLNTKYFPKSTNLPNFVVSEDLRETLDQVNYVVLAVPSKVMDIVFAQVLGTLNSSVTIINAAKGFFPDTQLSIHEGLEKASKSHKHIETITSLLGPSHAEAIVQELFTIVAVVGRDKEKSIDVQKLFNNDYFKTYIQNDIKGAEAGATYKNILAIATGIAEGLGYGVNAKAAIIARGFAEMGRYNKKKKGKPETILGLTGLGDLIVTATSSLSRNYRFGIAIAEQGLKKALNTKETVEGFSAINYVYEFMIDQKMDLPIVDILYQLLNFKIEIKEAIDMLWYRELKSE